MDVEVSWNTSLETLIGQEGEKCSGLSWLYTESERYYNNRNNYIALPVIVLSTVTGFISGSSQLLFSNASTASIGVGGVSLFTGILSTVGSYFSWAKKAEACRITALQYSKLLKFITIELTLPKDERIRAKDMLKMIRETVERLLETSPAVPPHIIAEYKAKFHAKTDITHPEMTTGVIKLMIYHEETDTSTTKKIITSRADP
jgi:hypothetical protein